MNIRNFISYLKLKKITAAYNGVFLVLFVFYSLNGNSQSKITYKALKNTNQELFAKSDPITFNKKKLGILTQSISSKTIETAFQTKKTIFDSSRKQSNSFKLETFQSKPKGRKITPKIYPLGNFKAKDNINYAIKYLDQSCGLPSNKITSIDEDNDGNIWIAYSGGLAKISASSIQIYDASVGLPDFPITNIKFHQNSVFAGTFGGGLIELKNDIFYNYIIDNGFQSDFIIDISAVSDELYFATYGEGILKRNKNGDFSKLISEVLESNKIIEDICSFNNELYFVTNEGYAAVRNNSIDSYGQACGILKDEYSHIECALNGDIYMSSKANFLIKIGKNEIKLYTDLKSNQNIISHLFIGESGKIWISTSEDGLYSLGTSSLIKYTTESGLVSNKIYRTFQDKYDNLWIMSVMDGLNLFTPSNFASQLTKSTSVNQILVTDSGDIIYENELGGLNFQKGNTMKTLYHPSLKRIKGLIFDDKNSCYWITTDTGFYQLIGNQLWECELGGENARIRSFMNISMDKKGTIWLNEYNYGILKFENNKVFHFPDWTSKLNTLTYYSFSDSKGNTWVCGDKGNLSCFSNTKDKIKSYTIYCAGNKIKLFNGCETKPGEFMFGSNIGAIRLKNGVFEALKFPFDLKNERIQSIKYIPETQTLWMSLQAGIISITDDVIDYFDDASGLPSGSFRLNGMSSSGESMYWSTSKGIIQYIPYRFRNLDIIHPIRLENLTLSDLGNNWEKLQKENYINYDHLKNFVPQNLEIPLNYNEITLFFSTTNWGREQSTRYYYRFKENEDSSWIYCGNSGVLQLKNLTGGKHTVEVKAQMPFQVHSNLLSYSFVVKIPFYQELWFLVSVCLFLILTIYLVIRSYSEFSFDHFSTLANNQLLIHQVRILCLFIIVSFFASLLFFNEINKYFNANWPLNVFVLTTFIALFVYTFSSKVNHQRVSILMLLSYLHLCVFYLYLLYTNEFSFSISISCAIYLILSIFIIQGVRNTFIFSASYLIISSILLYISAADIEHKIMFISVITQISFAIIIFKRLEDKKLEKVLFSDKLLNSAPVFVIVSEVSGKIVFINDYTAEHLGFKIKDALNYGWWGLRNGTEEENKVRRNMLIQNIKDKKSSAYSNTFINKKTGKEVIIEWQDTPIEGKYMLGIGSDITTETNQRIELEKLSMVAKNVTNGVIITNSENEIEWVNDSYLQLMGYQTEELIGTKITNQFYTLDKSLISISEKELIDSNTNFEVKQTTKDGKSRYFVVNMTNVKSPETGLIKKIHVLTDITEDKKLKERHSYILSNAGDIIYTANKYGNFDYINAALTKQLGYLQEELIGKSYTTLIHPEDLNDVIGFYAMQIKNNSASSYKEFRVISKDKKIKHISQTVTFILDDLDRIDGFQAIVRDITFIKEIEQEKTERNERLRIYSRALSELSKIRNNQEEGLELFFNKVCLSAANCLNIPRVSIWLFEENSLRCVANNEANEYVVNTIFPENYPIYFNVLNNDLIIQSNDTSLTPELIEFKELFAQNDIRALLHQPIRSNGEFIGMLCVEARTTIEWLEQDVNFTKSLADLVSVSFESNRRRKAEETIKQSEANFRMLNETIDDVFWLFDPINEKMIYVSPSCKEVLGITQHDYLTTDNAWLDYILEEDHSKVLAAHKKIQTDGYYEIEYRIHCENEIKWIFEKSFGIMDNEGVIIRTSGICSDISARKETERTIKQLSLVAQKTRNPIVISDGEGRIEWVNNAFEELTEYKMSEIKGTKPGSFLQGEKSSERTVKKIREGLRKKVSIKEEIINYTKSGREYWTELNIDPVFDEEGNLINYIAVEHDVSDRKHKEDLIESQHLDIINSINYAKRIQNALLPTDQQRNKLEIEIEIFNKPKDIIGGDFYWFDKIYDTIILAVGDCTGHGVPGALMTSLGINGFINSVSERKMTDPSDILRYIDRYITDILKTSENVDNINDGMDIGIVAINLKTKKISFSGAGRPLYYIKENELIKINGSLKSIGSDFSEFPFETTTLDFLEDDQFYLFSDGMVDQFGGEYDKRMGTKQFTQFLHSNQHCTMAEQKEKLIHFYEKWMRSSDQTDDMIWVGLKSKKD